MLIGWISFSHITIHNYSESQSNVQIKFTITEKVVQISGIYFHSQNTNNNGAIALEIYLCAKQSEAFNYDCRLLHQCQIGSNTWLGHGLHDSLAARFYMQPTLLGYMFLEDKIMIRCNEQPQPSLQLSFMIALCINNSAYWNSLKGKFPQTTMWIGWVESNFRIPK